MLINPLDEVWETVSPTTHSLSIVDHTNKKLATDRCPNNEDGFLPDYFSQGNDFSIYSGPSLIPKDFLSHMNGLPLLWTQEKFLRDTRTWE